jgi:hypothetical protein
MPSFVSNQYPDQHPGVTRIESAIEGAMQLRKSWSPTRGLVALLLTAVAAAVLVVAYEVMDSVVEGHLLVLWIALWAAGFASLAMLSGTVSRVGLAAKSGLDAWAQRQARSRADERLWSIAHSDSRVMADLQVAMSRHQAMTETSDVLSPAALAGTVKSTVLTRRAIRLGSDDLRAFIRQIR